jgi:hypothetical protein
MLAKAKRFAEDGRMHFLLALPDEPNPHDNHIHVRMDPGEWVVCDVKIDGVRVINRRLLVEEIRRATGLDLKYA